MANKNGKDRKQPVRRNSLRLCVDLKGKLLDAQVRASREGASEFEEAFDTARVILVDALKMHEASEPSVDVNVDS